ncbi:MAG: pyruvate kinase [bacterium]
MKKTKIVCTIGPSSWDEDTLKRMIDNGMNVARLNGAYIDIAEMERVAKLVRKLSNDVAILLDIKGHELRLNKFDNPKEVKVGDEIVIGSTSDDEIYSITYPELYKDLKVGSTLLVDKGKTTLTVKEIKDCKIYCEVLAGKVIAPGKGINTPGSSLQNSPVTERDIEQIKFAIKDNWDFVAASFIRSKEDVAEVKSYMGSAPMKLIAKIEDGFGIENIDSIIESCDGIMIARGDLAVEVPYEKIPIYQKLLITKARNAGKIAITATEFLASMVKNPAPTRAEIVDIANAVLDGTDALMLSEETASGEYPYQCVEVMDKISREMERTILPFKNTSVSVAGIERDAITRAAFEICETIHIDKIVINTRTGMSAQSLSRHKLKQPIIALCSNEDFRRQMIICSNIYSYYYEKVFSQRDTAVEDIVKHIIEKKIVETTDRILLLGKTASINGKSNYIFEIIDCSVY